MSASRAKKKKRRRARAAAPPAPAAAPPEPSPAADGRSTSRFDVRDGVARPHAIWAPFPLTEIGIAAGIAILTAGYLSDGRRAAWLLGVGALMLIVVISELSLREHFGGFRSHTLLLALMPVVALHATIVLAITEDYGGQLGLAADIVLAGALGWWLHRRFQMAHERAAAPP